MATALSPQQRLQIYDRHLAGETLVSIAQDMGIHYETARKWWRIGHRDGREAITERQRKRPGLMHKVHPAVVERIVQLRQDHSTWGMPYLRAQLLADASLSRKQRATTPSLATIYRYFHRIEDEPFGRRRPKNKVPTKPLIADTTHAHHLWQMDLKEKSKIEGLKNRVTVANVRDTHSSVTIGSHIFELTRTSPSVTQADIQGVCRACFADWGLPDTLRTDNGSCFVGTMSQTGFPSYLMLWLTGLGVVHETITKGKPTQNGGAERYHRTYNNLVLRDGPFDSIDELRKLSDDTVEFLNTKFPSRAGSCQHQAPLEAHPEAAKPRREYEPETEVEQFSLQRVDQLLAKFIWQRRTDLVGKLSLARSDYHLGRENKQRVFDVTFDPTDRHFVFRSIDGNIELRRPACALEVADIMNIAASQHSRLRANEKAQAVTRLR